jgi:LysR family glycine cleavage system transcriptional activator
MKRRLPPFAAVKAFEAAARHCNFQLAAKELGISASAVSHQVRSLEDFAATPLFIRRNNRLILRNEGKVYYEQLGSALDSIEHATESLIRASGRGQIKVNLFPSLADLWLIPRLGDFYARNSDISVRLNTSDLVGDNLTREADFALVYLHKTEIPDGATVLFSDDIVPAVAPDYLARNGPLEKPADLLGHPLIASLSEDEEWKYWFGTQGVDDIGKARQIELDMCSSCMKAAKEGQGVVMGRRPYLDDDLVSGQLVVPIKNKVSTGFCLALVMTPRGEDLPFGARFRNWIIEVSRESERVWNTIA